MNCYFCKSKLTGNSCSMECTNTDCQLDNVITRHSFETNKFITSNKKYKHTLLRYSRTSFIHSCTDFYGIDEPTTCVVFGGDVVYTCKYIEDPKELNSVYNKIYNIRSFI